MLNENGFRNASKRSSSEKSLKRQSKTSCSNLIFSMYFAKLTVFQHIHLFVGVSFSGIW